MNVVAWVASIILLLELFLVALSALLGLEVWRQRMWEVTGWRVVEPVRWLIAGFALVTGALIVLGLGEPRYAVAGGVLCAAASAVVLIRRMLVTAPGRGTGAYLTFLACGVLLTVSA
ncbi:hypothetical protein [Kineosporia babensis]|uniref:Uncharacterized protein n=1 Tax=Kineosporia babensis TaxID=499548 RepID=A0A9X1SSI9_9ACTN|nr:hypothetical protein [Kineosporia babensis]MCD5310629.1 hypothetical protein [Kineosporia babensis]